MVKENSMVVWSLDYMAIKCIYVYKNPPPPKNPSEKEVHWLLLLKVKVLLASPTASFLCFPAVRMTMMHSDFSSCSKLKAKHCNEDIF